MQLHVHILWLKQLSRAPFNNDILAKKAFEENSSLKEILPAALR